jgi:uroporphyrinogen-III synthase
MTGETILITRPKGDEQPLTDALHERGYRVIHEPLTEIFLLHTERAKIHHALASEPDAIIVTSGHGAQALSLLTELRDPFLICVGEATAHTAQSLGFSRVSAAGGTVQKLIDYITDGYDQGAQFLYIAGKHVRVDLPEALAAYSMQVEQITAYEALASQQLSDTLVEQLRRRQIDAVTFMSPRAAQIFTALLAKAGIHDATARLDAFCISEAAAAPLDDDVWQGIHIADKPTLASVLNCMDNRLK